MVSSLFPTLEGVSLFVDLNGSCACSAIVEHAWITTVSFIGFGLVIEHDPAPYTLHPICLMALREGQRGGKQTERARDS